MVPKGVHLLPLPDMVEQEFDVEGIVVSENWKINVLVHPRTSNEWWVQQVPVAGRDRRWRARMVFGAPGEKFEVMAIAVPKGTLFEEGQALQTSSIPNRAMRSKVYQVTRSGP